MSIERLTALQNDIRNTFNQWIEVSDKYLRTGLEDGHGRD